MPEPKFVTYLRQASRPRLDPGEQRTAVEAYVAENGGCVVVEVIEVERVRATDRVALRTALSHCRAYRATLLVPRFAKLLDDDRVVLDLTDDVSFVALDAPEVTRMTIRILAEAAKHRKAAMSARVRAGQQAARDRGVRFGNPKGVGNIITAADRARAGEARTKAAQSRAELLRGVIDDLRASGARTSRELADALNRRGVPAMRGGLWGPEQVNRVLTRLDIPA